MDDYMEQASNKVSSSNEQTAPKPQDVRFPELFPSMETKNRVREYVLGEYEHALGDGNDQENQMESASEASDAELIDKPTLPKEKEVPVLQSESPAFEQALYYRMYRLELRYSLSDSPVPLDAHEETAEESGYRHEVALFKPGRRDNYTDFPAKFPQWRQRAAYQRRRSHVVATVSPKGVCKRKLYRRMTRRGIKTPGSLTTYSLIINHLMSTYSADEVLSKAEEDVTRCVQANRMSDVEF